MATTETRAAFARRHGVNRSTVGRWETKGSLVLTVDGLVNVEASEQLLGSRAETYRGGKSKGPSAQTTRKRAQPSLDVPPDPLTLARIGLAEVIRAIGPYAARMAVEFGASLEVAYGLDQAVAVEADEIAGGFLTRHGDAASPQTWGTLASMDLDFTEVDWKALAEIAGASLDLDALDTWFMKTDYWRAPPKAAT